MSPDPYDPSDLDSEDIIWFSYDWCALPWSPWVPFSADRHAFHEIPDEPGLYRIREVGTDCLMYIGETKRPLRKRLHDLRIELSRAEQMPWSDPHAEAPALWAYIYERLSNLEKENHLKDASTYKRLSNLEEEKNPQDSSTSEWPPALADISSGSGEPAAGPGPRGYECSAAPLDASAAGRKGMESFLLCKYRQERGESPLCNFGRFHPRYRRSTDRKENKRGGRLAENQKDNPAGLPSIPPLDACGKPGDPGWMGLKWTARRQLPTDTIPDVAPGAGLYVLLDAVSREILYIGQSADVGKRLLDHSRKDWKGRTLQFSYKIIGPRVLPHHLKELENDLVGNFFEQNRKAPEFQFRNNL